MKNALNKSEEFEKYFQLLANRPDSIFSTMKDLYIIATIIGFMKGYKKPFEKSAGEPIRSQYFDQNDKNIMDIIALSENMDLSILTKEREEEKYILIEEYANGGMEILVSNYFNNPLPNIEDLKKIIITFQDKDDLVIKKDISSLLDAALNDL